MKSILLAEDDSFLSNIYFTKLKEAGYSVDIAIDGESALVKIKEKKPDLVLLDIVLPKISGWDVLEEINKDGNLKDIKIIILSNLDQKERYEKNLEIGIVKYLVKAHYTPSEVVEEVKEALK